MSREEEIRGWQDEGEREKGEYWPAEEFSWSLVRERETLRDDDDKLCVLASGGENATQMRIVELVGSWVVADKNCVKNPYMQCDAVALCALRIVSKCQFRIGSFRVSEFRELNKPDLTHATSHR